MAVSLYLIFRVIPSFATSQSRLFMVGVGRLR